MIDEKTIYRMKGDAYDSIDLRRWVDQLLAERELLVREHEAAREQAYMDPITIGMDETWQAVEDFDVASVPRRSSIVAIGT